MRRRLILLIFSASFLVCLLLACAKTPGINKDADKEVDTSTLVTEIEKMVGAGHARIHYLSADYLKDQIGVGKGLLIALANLPSDKAVEISGRHLRTGSQR
jgi:hypothetical protein